LIVRPRKLGEIPREGFVRASPTLVRSLRREQLQRIHGLWRRWTGKLGLSRDADRELRHYYIRCFTGGNVLETLDLTEADATLVIAWLAKLIRRANSRLNRAAGTAGRQGYPERARTLPDASARRALWACASALGMDRARLDQFIRKHYAGVGLQGLDDLHTMADLNRVLWGLKAILRRKPEKRPSYQSFKWAA
jgi:hypothetical protein